MSSRNRCPLAWPLPYPTARKWPLLPKMTCCAQATSGQAGDIGTTRPPIVPPPAVAYGLGPAKGFKRCNIRTG
jgi:hypothetical protein